MLYVRFYARSLILNQFHLSYQAIISFCDLLEWAGLGVSRPWGEIYLNIRMKFCAMFGVEEFFFRKTILKKNCCQELFPENSEKVAFDSILWKFSFVKFNWGSKTSRKFCTDKTLNFVQKLRNCLNSNSPKHTLRELTSLKITLGPSKIPNIPYTIFLTALWS